jgi:fatty acid amide hydrolase 2
VPVQWIYTAIWNTLWLPVTQCPLGLNEDGIPVGVQVVGKRGCDDLTIGVAVVLEKLCGGWKPPIR